jgi:hypothetical protein
MVNEEAVRLQREIERIIEERKILEKALERSTVRKDRVMIADITQSIGKLDKKILELDAEKEKHRQ